MVAICTNLLGRRERERAGKLKAWQITKPPPNQSRSSWYWQPFDCVWERSQQAYRPFGALCSSSLYALRVQVRGKYATVVLCFFFTARPPSARRTEGVVGHENIQRKYKMIHIARTLDFIFVHSVQPVAYFTSPAALPLLPFIWYYLILLSRLCTTPSSGADGLQWLVALDDGKAIAPVRLNRVKIGGNDSS